MSAKVKIILGTIILVGGLLRIVALDQWPNGIHPDEIVIGLSAESIAKTGTDYRQTGHPPLYVTGLSARFDNRTSVLAIYASTLFHFVMPPSLWAIRLPGALVGTLTIFLMFLLARLLFKDNAIALTAAGTLALSPYHIYYSRFGNDAIFSIALIVAGTLLFRRALQSRRSLTFVASALLLALTLYGYLTYKLLTPLFVLLLIASQWQQLRHNPRGLFVWLGTGVLAAVPTILLHITKWSAVMVEFNFVHAQSHGSTSPIFLITNLFAFFLPQFWASPRTTLMLDGVAAVFGALWVLRTRHPEMRLLLGWLLWFPLAAIFTDTVFVHPNPLRGSSWLSILPLLAGAGIVAVVRRYRHEVMTMIAVAVVSLSLVVTGGVRIWSHWSVGDVPTCCFTFGSRVDQPIFDYLRTQVPTDEVVVSDWGENLWQQGLIYAYMMRLDPQLIQRDTRYEPQHYFTYLDHVTSVGRFRFCNVATCYQPNDGKLYIVRAEELPNMPSTVLTRNRDGSVRFRAVRNIQTH